MKVLVACEFSGTVRDAFIRAGHDAISCDILPSDSDFGPHIHGDILNVDFSGYDLMIAHPPCTYLSVSGLHWNKRNPERHKETIKALEFVRRLLSAPVDKIALENPVSCISSQIMKPSQIIQPHQFGHDASKKTCLWLKNLPNLTPTKPIEPRMCGGENEQKPRWGNQTDSGQNKLGPSADRWKIRSKTYQGIADAMADQWG